MSIHFWNSRLPVNYSQRLDDVLFQVKTQQNNMFSLIKFVQMSFSQHRENKLIDVQCKVK